MAYFNLDCKMMMMMMTNRTQLYYSSTETLGHVTRTIQRDWSESCFGARNCDELASNVSWKYLEQVSRACVAGIRR